MHMLEGWHEFYGLLGTAAAALAALLFVAASIGTGFMSTAASSPTRTFTSPVLFHYTYVLFVSLIALVPVETDRSLAVLVGISAMAALAYSIGPPLLAGALIFSLLVNIRNTWDLTVFFAQRRDGGNSPPPNPN
jgi:hypothetical protein